MASKWAVPASMGSQGAARGVNSETRERVWEMNDRRVRYAGGASKNIKWVGSIELAKGSYELTYVTDDSHSADDWNAKPPFDPLSYGITLSAKNDGDMRSVRISDVPDITRNVIVDLTGARDNEFKQSGFTLRNETRLRVYTIGEQGHRGEMADYGWIVNARTREKVWVMNVRETFHAGGASKNRVADAVITPSPVLAKKFKRYFKKPVFIQCLLIAIIKRYQFITLQVKG